MKVPGFSQRTGWNTDPTEWARLLARRLDACLPIIDLTASNPTRCGFKYDTQTVLDALREPNVLDYDPQPKGAKRARHAIAQYYADQETVVDPDHIFLTTSTSEAYSFLFKLLCDPGDEILVAQPSYPLFDFLASLDNVRLVPYSIFYDYGWHLDPEALRRKITRRTKAIVVVHPNNPTGNFTKKVERLEIERVCAEYGLALIVDEVFLDYAIREDSPRPESFVCGEHPILTFVLSGISKIAALPQMKVAWLACFGPGPTLSPAMQRLEVICDTFLSMNTPVQYALPAWLASRKNIQRQILLRLTANLRSLDQLLDENNPIRRLIVEAGWSVVLRIPANLSADSIAFAVLEAFGVSVHSGVSFGFVRKGWLVASLLSTEADFTFGINALKETVR